VAMNPWQQLKLTLLTLGAVLRGNALAPQTYKPVPSTVRSDDEVNAMLAVSSIKGGINASREKKQAAVEVCSPTTPTPDAGSNDTAEKREPAGVA
jgi:geranylgeranyl diphosphate/geranylgeranyl-bacteriochlorophyllide a reductase